MQKRCAILQAILILLVSIFLAACGGPPPSAITAAPNVPTPSALPSQPTAAPRPTSAPSIQTAPTQSLQSRVLAPTPVCGSALSATPAMTEGPFFKPNSPERLSLIEPGMTGTKIVVVGYVLSADCKPIARALTDFWQANDQGDYDNVGYKLRGHQFTDDAGRYYLETIVPGLYPGRTRHIHVKVQVPNRPALTTQLFFPGEARNQSDSIFDRALLLNVQDTTAGKVATFNFVLDNR